MTWTPQEDVADVVVLLVEPTERWASAALDVGMVQAAPDVVVVVVEEQTVGDHLVDEHRVGYHLLVHDGSQEISPLRLHWMNDPRSQAHLRLGRTMDHLAADDEACVAGRSCGVRRAASRTWYPPNYRTPKSEHCHRRL